MPVSCQPPSSPFTIALRIRQVPAAAAKRQFVDSVDVEDVLPIEGGPAAIVALRCERLRRVPNGASDSIHQVLAERIHGVE